MAEQSKDDVLSVIIQIVSEESGVAAKDITRETTFVSGPRRRLTGSADHRHPGRGAFRRGPGRLPHPDPAHCWSADDLDDDGQDVVLALLSHGGSFWCRDGAFRFRSGAVTR